MVEFTVNATRRDPYPNFKFLVKFDGNPNPVAGISKVSVLKRTTEVIKHRSGGDPSSSRKSPGRVEYEPITLERGITHDLEFEKWVTKVWNYGAGSGMEVALNGFRRNITIDVLNESGQIAKSYNVFRCWVSEYQIAELDANANAVLIEHIKLENEGWIRDEAVSEPTEPSF